MSRDVDPNGAPPAIGSHRVIATAGHVDHGKSSLIRRLTGIEPDRWDEERRRGLTIDLGYAWCELPSGREVGFVDVPGHERFIRNMLAGVGPVPLVLFVVAADEGWKPQSEEHLAILDVLGVRDGVVALTKRDLVDDETLAIAEDEVRERLAGTSLAGARVVPVSATTGADIDELLQALDATVAAAVPPPPGPPRLFVDRVFTIQGAGTVVTGTLTGDGLAIGDEVAIEPGDRRARIRALQTHERSETTASPVARVAANLVGIDRNRVERGDVLTRPTVWWPTSTFDAEVRAVRGLRTPVTPRGAFKVYAGAAEADALVRFLDGDRLAPGGRAFARIRSAHPLVLAVGDRIVLRDAGPRTTIAGGTVLDLDPSKASTAPARLAARAAASPAELARLLVAERGAVRAEDVARLVGAAPDALVVTGGWAIDPTTLSAVERAVVAALDPFHAREPIAPGIPIGEMRALVASTLRARGAPDDPGLVDTMLEALPESVERTATVVRRRGHSVVLDADSPQVRALLEAIGGEHEVTPPTVGELSRTGIGRDVIEAASAAGLVVRVSSELVFVPAVAERAELFVRSASQGFTVSAFREAMGTSRKFALPLLEHFDRSGVTRRDGDLRFPR